MTNSHFDYNPSYCSTGLSSWILINSWPCLELQTDGKVVTNTCLATQPRKKTWRQLSPMPYKLFNAASAVFNDRLYIIGGIDDTNTITKNVLEYEPLTDRWGISIKQKSEFTIALKLKSRLCYFICSQIQ